MSADGPRLEYWETDEYQWFYDHRQVVTEADWLSCPNPGALVDYVNQTDRVSRRKFFLAGAACVRRIWHLLTSPESRAAVEAAERYADGHCSKEELRAITDSAATIYQQWPTSDPRFMAGLSAVHLSHCCRGNHGNAEHTMYASDDVPKAVALTTDASEGSEAWYSARQGEQRILADLYRCVIGNPFRPLTFAPQWRTDNVLGLAQAIYEDRAFDRLPILADALEDAGCDSADLLNHCRGQGPHARGCFVVDLILGRE